jgi:hypothetical protein
MASSRVRPPMDHVRDAKALTDRLLTNIGGKRDYSSQSLEIYAADVEAAVDRFDSQTKFCNEAKVGFPCISLSTPMPVDWSNLFAFFGQDIWLKSQARQNYAWFDQGGSSLSLLNNLGGIKHVSSADAVSYFRERLVAFLTVRFSARQSNISTNPGLKFRVMTQGIGLRVHWSPAYFFNPHNVFGSPTSPVDAWIQPGKYIFGAVSPTFSLKFDVAEFDVPPLTEATLVNI